MEISISELAGVLAESAFSEPDVKQNDTGGFPLLGRAVFVRTVTYHYIGYAKSVEGGFLKLESASWIADSGRWADALKTGELSEIEPYPGSCYVAITSIVDISHWNHSVPREQK